MESHKVRGLHFATLAPGDPFLNFHVIVKMNVKSPLGKRSNSNWQKKWNYDTMIPKIVLIKGKSRSSHAIQHQSLTHRPTIRDTDLSDLDDSPHTGRRRQNYFSSSPIGRKIILRKVRLMPSRLFVLVRETFERQHCKMH